MAVTQAGDRGAAGGVQKLLAIFKEEVASFAADGLFGDETRIAVEDCALGSFICCSSQSRLPERVR